MMRSWDSCRAPRLVYLFGAYWHLLALIEMHWFEPWVRSVLRLPLLLRDWSTWWQLVEPLVLYFLMMICHPRVQTICVLRTSHLVVQATESHLSFCTMARPLNVCPLAIAIALGYAPSDFGLSTQKVRTYNSTKLEVMGTLEIELLIGSTTFPIMFQVLRIPTFFNLLLGRPWIHRAGVIPSSLH